MYNAESPISKAVAEDYIQKRAITNVLPIHCPDSAVSTRQETISLAAYREIEAPIRQWLAAHPGVDIIVLTKGVPIRIVGAETGCRPVNSSPDTPLAASLDSRLAALDYPEIPAAVKIKITGSGATGFGWLNRYYDAHVPFSHEKFGGYLVSRLDGYTEADAKALVGRALLAEKGLADGRILLDTQPNFGLGDKTTQPAPIRETVIPDEAPWQTYNADMVHAHDILQARGIADELDLAPAFIGHRTNLLGYCSWGSNDPKFSAAAYQSLSFAPGSICDTAVSTSARTFLPTRGGQSLLTDLIAHGLTCGKGYCDEPLLQAIASPTILLDRYTAGWTMVESFSAASHFTGWEDIVIGDPLCAPYAGASEKKPSAQVGGVP